MLNIFTAGINSIGLAAQWNTMASGALLLIALSIDFINEKSKAKALKAKKTTAMNSDSSPAPKGA